MNMYNQTRSDLLPFIQGGGGAFSQLQGLLGLNGGNPQSMLANLEQTPGYQFAFNQGENALDRSAASRGLLLSGGQVKDATKYGQDMASGLYQQTVGNLFNTANLGENAAAQSGTQGNAAAGQAGNFLTNGAEATAGGYTGAANALGGPNGVFQNAVNAYALAYPSASGGAGAGVPGGGISNGATSLAYSDRRLKTDIHRVGTLDSGLPVYSYRMKGSMLPQMGVMAHEVRRVAPRAVHRDHRTGFDKVDYSAVSRLPSFKEAA